MTNEEMLLEELSDILEKCIEQLGNEVVKTFLDDYFSDTDDEEDLEEYHIENLIDEDKGYEGETITVDIEDYGEVDNEDDDDLESDEDFDYDDDDEIEELDDHTSTVSQKLNFDMDDWD